MIVSGTIAMSYISATISVPTWYVRITYGVKAPRLPSFNPAKRNEKPIAKILAVFLFFNTQSWPVSVCTIGLGAFWIGCNSTSGELASAISMPTVILDISKVVDDLKENRWPGQVWNMKKTSRMSFMHPYSRKHFPNGELSQLNACGAFFPYAVGITGGSGSRHAGDPFPEQSMSMCCLHTRLP